MANKRIRGRGASFNPPNRFERLHLLPLDIDLEDTEDQPQRSTVFLNDRSKTVLAKNDSPDLPFAYSINPYRGCEHGCIYCYARPGHEFLGFSAGIDFESKILVKVTAPELLEATFKKKSWQPQMVCFSGDTDCYQPIERKLKLTRRCLEVFLKFRNPVGLITKNALVTRDLDILKELAGFDLVMVTISITSFDDELVRRMEPRTPAPYKRLETIESLAKNGIPVCVNVSPIIPGLNDEEMPAILKSAAERGATLAGYSLLRLPGPVEQLFVDWIQRELPERAARILNRIRDVRGGSLNETRWTIRMKGKGEIARAINDLFNITCRKLGLNQEKFELSTKHFRREPTPQLEIFA